MTVEDAFARLTEGSAHAGEVRSVLLVNLLRREGVLDFVTGYAGDPAPIRVAEAAKEAGLDTLDDLDLALLALAVSPGKESTLSPTGTEGKARWIGGSSTAPSVSTSLAARWREMSDVDRVETAVELMAEPAIREFRDRRRHYPGPVDPAHVVESARSDGIRILTDEGLVTLAVLCGWDPEG